METNDRMLIAQALGVAEDARNMRFILNVLEKAGTGRLQAAALREENGNKTLFLVAESGANYRMLLSPRGNPDALQDLETGKWLFRTFR